MFQVCCEKCFNEGKGGEWTGCTDMNCVCHISPKSQEERGTRVCLRDNGVGDITHAVVVKKSSPTSIVQEVDNRLTTENWEKRFDGLWPMVFSGNGQDQSSKIKSFIRELTTKVASESFDSGAETGRQAALASVREVIKTFESQDEHHLLSDLDTAVASLQALSYNH